MNRDEACSVSHTVIFSLYILWHTFQAKEPLMFLDALLGSSNPKYCVLFLLVRYNVQCTELRFLDLNPSIE